MPNTVAAQVGLQPGDKIVEVNGIPVRYHDEVLPLVRQRTDSVSFVVERGAQRLTLPENFPINRLLVFTPQFRKIF